MASAAGLMPREPRGPGSTVTDGEARSPLPPGEPPSPPFVAVGTRTGATTLRPGVSVIAADAGTSSTVNTPGSGWFPRTEKGPVEGLFSNKTRCRMMT